MAYDITQFSPGYGGTIDSSGNVKNFADTIDASGNIKVAIMSGGGGGGGGVSSYATINNDVVAVTMQNAATATGSGYTLNTANSAFAVIDVQGTFVGTVIFEYTIDGTNYYPLELVRQSDKSLQTTATAAGQFAGRVSGFVTIKARISAYTSGSITVYGRASANGTGHHTVTIVNTPNVAVTSMPTTTVTGSVGITGTPSVAVTSMPTTTVTGSVGITGTPNVTATISGTPNVAVTSTPATAGSDGQTGSATPFTAIGVLNGSLIDRLAIASYTANDTTSSSSSKQILTASAQMLYSVSDTALVRLKSNYAITVLASASRTATPTTSNITNYNLKGIVIIVNVIVFSGTGITPSLAIYDSISGNFKTTTTFSAITATGLYTYLIYPGADNVNGSHTAVVSQSITRQFRANMTHSDSSAVTYSISADLLT